MRTFLLHAQDDWLIKVLTAEPVWSLEGDVLTLRTDTETLRLKGSRVRQLGVMDVDNCGVSPVRHSPGR